MTLTGKIFAVLNVLLAVGFLFLASPVAKERIDKGKRIDETRAKLPDLKSSLDDQEREQIKIRLQRARLDGLVSYEKTINRNQQVQLNSSLYLIQDKKNDAASRGQNLKGAEASAEQEIQTRQKELQDLDAEFQQFEATERELTAENNRLKEQTEGLAARVAKLSAENAAMADKLKTDSAKLPEPPSNVASK